MALDFYFTISTITMRHEVLSLFRLIVILRMFAIGERRITDKFGVVDRM